VGRKQQLNIARCLSFRDAARRFWFFSGKEQNNDGNELLWEIEVCLSAREAVHRFWFFSGKEQKKTMECFGRQVFVEG
jgi:hypothetical protein